MAIDVNIPSQVKNYANLAAFPASGSLKTIYIAEDTNKTYRWTGSVYVEISASQATAWGTITGTLSAQTDLNTALSGKVPTTRTLTINGTTQDLSADRTFTISTGITIGTTAITSGTVGRVLFEGAGNVVSESANLFWDNTNGRLGIGTSSPPSILFLRNGPAPMFGIDTISSQTEIAVYNQASYEKALRIDGDGQFFWHNGTYITPNNNGIYFQNTATTTPVRILGNPINTTIFHVTDNTGSTGLFMVRGATGNVLIGTTTDAGFRLDVNGTARVSGNTTIGTGAGVELNFQNSNVGLYRSGSALRLGGFSGIEFLASNTALSSQTVRMVLFDTGNLCIGNTLDVASARLIVNSTTQGFLPPRMTTTQKNAIATPATGLQVYDTTLNRPCFYDGTTWITL